MAVRPEDRELLLQHVYLHGYPAAYSNSIILLGIREDVYYQVIESLSYGVSERGSFTLYAGFTLATVLAICGFYSGATALGVLTFAFDTVTGLYELVKDSQVRKYDLSAYYARQVRLGGSIDGSIYCTAQKPVRWTGYVGDREAGIEFEYETQHWAYDDPSELVNIALANYMG
jgi:hypothetical protein